MTKNIIIAVLSATLFCTFLALRKEGMNLRATQISPKIKVIGWPEELAPSILDDSTFTATLRFKMNGPDSLSVNFVPQLRLINH